VREGEMGRGEREREKEKGGGGRGLLLCRYLRNYFSLLYE